MTDLAPYKPGEPLTADRLNAGEAAAVRHVTGGHGILAVLDGQGVAVSLAEDGVRVVRATGIIQGSATQDGDKYRWAYKIKLARKVGVGFEGTWEVYGLEIPAFNRLEWLSTNILPDGISDIKRIEAGLPVGVDLVIVSDRTLEAWFEVANDADCATPE